MEGEADFKAPSPCREKRILRIIERAVNNK
jgi:hypothetical protein